MSDLDRREDVDDHRSVLANSWEIGEHGWQFGEAIDPDGVTWFWLIDPDHAGPSTVAWPDHERLGRLPVEYRERLGQRHRCGRPNRFGKPCRMLVPERGAACEWHRGGRDA